MSNQDHSKHAMPTAELIGLYRQAEDDFFKAISKKTLNIDDVATCYMTGVPTADLNLVYVKKQTHSLGDVLKQAKKFFDQVSLGFVVIIPEHFGTDEIFKAINYIKSYECVALVFDLKNLTRNMTTHFDDGTVMRANDDQLNDWMVPMTAYPGTDAAMSRNYAETHKQALDKKAKLQHFSLYKQGKPIASVTLSLHEARARIDDVGTLPEFQGNGYATRLMIYVLSEAQKQGADFCFLEASESGLSIYQRLGFEPLFTSYVYTPANI